MKTLNLIAAALLTSGAMLAAPAFAADAAGNKTRAEVVAELAQARNSGELAQMHSEDTALFLAGNSNSGMAVAAKSRAQVQAELKQAEKSGELARSQSVDPTVAQGPAKAKVEQARGE